MSVPDCSSPAIQRMAPADARHVARVHAAAFPNHFLTSLGLPFLTLYYRAVAEDPATISIVATAEGRVCGLCVGAVDPQGFYSRLLKRKWPSFAFQAARAAVLRPSAIPRLMAAVGHPSAQVPDPEAAGLFSIAVSPEAQGSGTGGDLVRAFVAQARREAARSVVLETDDVDNDAVNHFYERHGFTVTDRYVTSHGRHMRRYTLSLQEERDRSETASAVVNGLTTEAAGTTTLSDDCGDHGRWAHEHEGWNE